MSVPSGPRTSKELVVAAWEHFDTEGQEKGDATSTGPPPTPPKPILPPGCPVQPAQKEADEEALTTNRILF